MIKLHNFNTTNQLHSKAREHLCAVLATPGILMLSGGSTPYAIYNQLASAPGPVHPDRRIFLSDERMVPTDSPSSNSGNLMPMLRALECENRFIRVDTRLPAAEAAERLARDLEPLKRLDFGLLGMGTDGHTAALFSEEQARIKSGPLTLHMDRPDGMQGISVTPALFHRVEKLILLVTGEPKRVIVNTLLHRPETIPAGIALSGHPDVELWTDIKDL